MTQQNKTKVESTERELIIERVFDAPRELVFETYTKCEHLNKWWGPREWPLSYCKMDFRVGGTWHYCMSGPNEGDQAWGKIFYKEIKQPARIVYEDYFSDKDGNINRDLPGTYTVNEFKEEGSKTKLVSRVTFSKAEDLKTVLEMGMIEGMTETLDRLDEHLTAMQK